MKYLDAIQTAVLKLVGNNYTEEWDNLNYKYIPTTVISAKPGNETEYNNIYQLLLKNKAYKPLKRTKSGGISITCNERFAFNKYDARQLGPVHEITICTLEFSARIQWRTNNYHDNKGKERLMTATQFYNKYWLPECKKCGIDMTKYYCSKEEGLKYKEKIHPADIKVYDTFAKMQLEITDAYHLDFHKFYPSGLIECYPEFKPIVEKFAKLAKTDEKYKIGIDSLIGLWQSETFDYKLAKLSKDAINAAYKKFDTVKALIRQYRQLVATNTDGIWYYGGEYHGIYESDELGGWSNDHFHCRIRFKSAGSYEYIENGKYTPVVRGYTKLDKTLDRSQWEWGDIMLASAEANMWTFKEGVGIVWQN